VVCEDATPTPTETPEGSPTPTPTPEDTPTATPTPPGECTSDDQCGQCSPSYQRIPNAISPGVDGCCPPGTTWGPWPPDDPSNPEACYDPGAVTGARPLESGVCCNGACQTAPCELTPTPTYTPTIEPTPPGACASDHDCVYYPLGGAPECNGTKLPIYFPPTVEGLQQCLDFGEQLLALGAGHCTQHEGLNSTISCDIDYGKCCNGQCYPAVGELPEYVAQPPTCPTSPPTPTDTPEPTPTPIPTPTPGSTSECVTDQDCFAIQTSLCKRVVILLADPNGNIGCNPDLTGCVELPPPPDTTHGYEKYRCTRYASLNDDTIIPYGDYFLPNNGYCKLSPYDFRPLRCDKIWVLADYSANFNGGWDNDRPACGTPYDVPQGVPMACVNNKCQPQLEEDRFALENIYPSPGRPVERPCPF
jgi:hypothetical protein